MEERLEALRQLLPPRFFPKQRLVKLAALFRLVTIPHRVAIVQEGNAPDGIFIIKQGACRQVAQNSALTGAVSSHSVPSEMELSVLGPGEVVGVYATLADVPQPTSVVADSEEVIAYAVHGSVFIRQLTEAELVGMQQAIDLHVTATPIPRFL